MDIFKLFVKKLLRRVRFCSHVNMFWTGKEIECPNFGDFIGPYLFNQMTGRNPVRKVPSNYSLTTTFMTVGSIMSWCREDSIVWGSGIVNRKQDFPRPYAVSAVRGPLTRQRFLEQGYECPEVFGDPGLLLPRFYTPRSNAKRYRFGVVPHYVDKDICAELLKCHPEILMIDVFQSIESVIDNICNCDLIVSSSLHGLIVAHAYGKKALWVKFSDKLWGDDTKFSDYYQSLGFDGDIVPFRIVSSFGIEDLNLLFNEILFNPNKDTVHGLQEGLLASCPFPFTKPLVRY